MVDRPCSLVLAAHGSLAAENSNQPLHDLSHAIANRLQSQPEPAKFSTVTPAFLNGEPQMTNVLESLEPGDVVIVPVMTSDGYYLKKLPAKFAENKNADQFRCFISPVVGVHPSIPNLISNRISKTLTEYEWDALETTVVVIGHGTRRNKSSGLSTFAITNQLELLHPVLSFKTAFLDQDPAAVDVAKEVTTRHTLVVPFLISRGPHSTEDVPEAFGLPSGPEIQFPIVSQNGKGTCICDLPVGMYPEIAEVCLELADDALRSEIVAEVPLKTSLDTDSGPRLTPAAHSSGELTS
jgi:sirohydrochlorin cobaltochelatase